MQTNLPEQTNVRQIKSRKDISRAAEIVCQAFGDQFVAHFLGDLRLVKQSPYAALYGYLLSKNSRIFWFGRTAF